MTAKEFARGLMKVAKEHENDVVSVFATNWSRLCKEAADYISKLDNELKDANEELNNWRKWYSENELLITKACRKSNEVDVPKLEDEPEKPEFEGSWDGIRRDME